MHRVVPEGQGTRNPLSDHICLKFNTPWWRHLAAQRQCCLRVYNSLPLYITLKSFLNIIQAA